MASTTCFADENIQRYTLNRLCKLLLPTTPTAALSHRHTPNQAEFEYLVKYKGASHLQCRWLTWPDLHRAGKTARMVLSRYLTKVQNLGLGEHGAEEAVDTLVGLEVERILMADHFDDERLPDRSQTAEQKALEAAIKAEDGAAWPYPSDRQAARLVQYVLVRCCCRARRGGLYCFDS